MKRRPYPAALLAAAGRCDIDAPRTPYAAAKEKQQRRYSMLRVNQAAHLVPSIAGEGLPVLTTGKLRVWP